jgi:hypothetical protein
LTENNNHGVTRVLRQAGGETRPNAKPQPVNLKVGQQLQTDTRLLQQTRANFCFTKL